MKITTRHLADGSIEHTTALTTGEWMIASALLAAAIGALVVVLLTAPDQPPNPYHACVRQVPDAPKCR